MCTVTFIPGREGIFLTSNRDEHSSRTAALSPQRYDALVYPKDSQAGGSWIVLKNDREAAVLLNGAFVPHLRQTSYRRSRGLVFLEIVQVPCPLTHFGDIDLTGIEPFTVILFIREQLFECRWDGQQKHLNQLATTQPHIWSSVTLYDRSAQEQRKTRLAQWYAKGEISVKQIIDFHQQARATIGAISTVSITSICINNGKGDMTHIDLKPAPAQSPPALSLPPAQSPLPPAPSGIGSLQRVLIRLRYWEYWPFFILYLPVFIYWAWLSIKARSFFFFNTSNPGILNGGFLLESKKAIYALMPAGSYPNTLFCPLGSDWTSIDQGMAWKGLDFPLIAKPDIGQRGLKVKLIRTERELSDYARQSKVDFLLQEYIDYPNEIGIFYYRIPGETSGHISGIVGKELLSVTGDGRSTIETLIQKESRAVLQLPALSKTDSVHLQTIPAAGEQVTLVPYGNHSRGAKFIDWSKEIDSRLESVIDELCRQVPGFYFGRLDIKFNSWEELREGRSFSVIELNGAGSEPTHIYDPTHSIFFAWAEIIRHLRLLYRISKANKRALGLPYLSFREGWTMLRDYARHEKLLTR